MSVVTVNLGGLDVMVADPASYPYGNGCFVDREPIHDAWERFRPWEERPDGYTLVDVGASFGAFTLSGLARGNRVIAVEPSEDGWRILNANVEINPWGNVQLHKAIAWDGETPYPEELWGSSLTRDYRTNMGVTRVTTLDELLKHEPRVDCIKLDVEGAELGALLGATGTLKGHRPQLLIEEHQDASDTHPACLYCQRIDSKRRIGTFLEALGYRLTWIPMEPRRMYLIAEAT